MSQRVTTPRFRGLCLAAAFAVSLPGLWAQNQTATLSPVVVGGNLPYTISLGVYNMGGAAQVPTLQSSAVGVYNGEWIIVAGRTNGLHNFTSDGFQNFPPAYQNTFIWVIDPATQQTWSRSLNDASAGLTASQVDSLSSTNTEFGQAGNFLYVIGGYGYTFDGTENIYTTYDTLTEFDLSQLVAWVKTGTPMLSTALQQIHNSVLKVAGGQLRFINGRALLVFGQDFEGGYTTASNGLYTQLVTAFDIVHPGGVLGIANVTQSTPLPEYRRRDLNVVPTIKSDGLGGLTEGLSALAGVFLPGPTGGAWTVPVEIDAQGVPSMADPNAAATFKQGMNTYDCANVSLYSASRDETHILSFGGISLEYYDPSTGQIAYDSGIPFINSISSIVRTGAGAYTQYYLGEYPNVPNPSNGNAPFLFGAEARFIPAPGITAYDNGVLNMDVLTQPTVIGYIYGGIIAAQGNFGTSGASNLIFQVTYSPALPPVPPPDPSIGLFGKTTKKTGGSSLELKGSSSSSTTIIQWRKNNGSQDFRSVAVQADGSWKIKVKGLQAGDNPIRLRGVTASGQRSTGQTVTIVRTGS